MLGELLLMLLIPSKLYTVMKHLIILQNMNLMVFRLFLC